MSPRLDPACWRAAWWAVGALRRLRGDLPLAKVTDVMVAAPPRLPPRAISGVEGVLARRPHTCLMRALVLQAWYAGQGDRREVVIGVTAPSKGFKAHAWVDGESPCHDEGFAELTRWSRGSAPQAAHADAAQAMDE